jgi:predicted acylesterase/phospholipase RssA
MHLHVVFGSGGTKTLLAGTGAILAFHVGELDQFETIGAASGGTFVASILARRMPPKKFLPEIIDTDFGKLVTPRLGFFRRLLALLNKFRHERTRPRRGVYSVTRLRRKLNQLVPIWPDKLWMVASGDTNSQILFTWTGVFRHAEQQPRKLICASPPAVGLAVAASCGIPGILDSTRYRGELLFDGALSGDGDVPVDVVTRHFAQHEDTLTLAMDVGEDPMKKKRWLRLLWHLFSGSWSQPPIDGVHPEPRSGLILVTPDITGFHPLQFKLTRETKWKALATGFIATAVAMCSYNLVGAKAQSNLRRFIAEFELLADTCAEENYCRNIEQFLRNENLLESLEGGQP